MDVGLAGWLRQIEEEGFALVPGVFSPAQVADMRASLAQALGAPSEAVRSDGGSVYAARNVLELWPQAVTVWRRAPLPELLRQLLGPGFGLVRALYFDKPPERTWALPWHKDLTVAVRDNQLPSRAFAKPTCKAGVPHVEAPTAVLERMATLRIHLDDVTEENGPLRVVPGSHRDGKELRLGATPPVSILAAAGDVLIMRPLLAHASNRSAPDAARHRRILHLEFAADEPLPDGYAWHQFRRDS